MLLPTLLILGMLVALGVALYVTLMRVRQTRLDLSRRIHLIDRATRGNAIITGAEMAVAGETGWRLVLGTKARGFYSFHLPRTWGMTSGAITLILIGGTGAVLAWLAVHTGLELSDWFAVPLTVIASIWAPRTWLKHQQSGADGKFMAVFPDTIDMVIRMLRAGLPITSAVRAVGEEALPPVNEVFTNIADKMAIGITFEEALAAAGDRIGLPDFRFFAVAISLQRSTGGNLATTLDILSDLMRKRRAARLKARATTGEVRMSAYVLGGIPFFILGGLLLVAPAYLQPLISDPRGRVIAAIAVTSLLIGFGIIRQLMRSVTGDV